MAEALAETARAVGWRLLDSAAKLDFARARFALGDGRLSEERAIELTLLIRPEGDPHPCFVQRAGLRFGYSMLNCTRLDEQRLLELERVIGAGAEHSRALLQAISQAGG